MNRLFKNKAPEFFGAINQKTARVRPLFAISLFVFSTLALTSIIYSPPASANRPAADEGAEMDNETSTNATEAPSAVEIMMQQETRQTGDVLQLPAKEMQPGETLKIKLLDYPRRGMSMDKVRQEYGQPVVVSDSVGEPPITRWTYQDRVVYFEHSTVLHVVAR